MYLDEEYKPGKPFALLKHWNYCSQVLDGGENKENAYVAFHVLHLAKLQETAIVELEVTESTTLGD